MLYSTLMLMMSSAFLMLRLTPGGSFPRPLSEVEERKYLDAWLQGDLEARNVLIERNLRLVAHIIKKYYASQNDQEDLISIGTIGLIKAIDTFDPAKGIRLSSYASRCIENEILMFFRSGRKSAQDVSLNEPIDTDKEGNALTILDTMAVDDTIVESIDTKMKSEKLYRFLQSSLTPREREVVCRRYGLLGFAPSPSGWWRSAWASPAATSPALRKRPWRSCASSSSRSACCRGLALSPRLVV